MVELNSDILKTIQSLQADLQSFKDDNMNEIKEQKVINESLMWNIMVGIPLGKPTHSTNNFKKEFCHKWANNPKEKGKEEHTPEPLERYCHTPSSDYSLSPCRKKQISDDNI